MTASANASITEKIAAFPGASAVRLGPLTVALWLPESAMPPAAVAALLHPDEERLAATFGAKTRRDEFRRSRALIRHLTGATAPLLPLPTGELAWPPGVQGSLTHKDGVVAVALENLDAAARFRAFGLDAEQIHRVHPGLDAKILTDQDQALVERVAHAAAQSLTAGPGGGYPARQVLAAVAFSFKEALFKAHFPLGQRMFWFHDAELTDLSVAAGGDSGRIAARVLVATSPHTPAGFVTFGHFRVLPHAAGALVLTAAVLSA